MFYKFIASIIASGLSLTVLSPIISAGEVLVYASGAAA